MKTTIANFFLLTSHKSKFMFSTMENDLNPQITGKINPKYFCQNNIIYRTNKLFFFKNELSL